MSRARRRLTRANTAGVALAALAAMIITLACGSGDETPAQKTPPTPPSAPTAPTPSAPPPAPEPVALMPGDAAAGAETYALFCASCHGEGGCGDGPVAVTLDPKPAAHCDGNVMNPLEDSYLIQVITEGGPAVDKSAMMAPWGGSLSEQQILDVVAFIRSLADPPYTP